MKKLVLIVVLMLSCCGAGCAGFEQLAKNMEKKNVCYGTKGMFIKFNLGFVKENMYIPCIDMVYAFGSQWFIDSPEAGSIQVLSDMIKASNGSGIVTASANGLSIDDSSSKNAVKIDTAKQAITPITPIATAK